MFVARWGTVLDTIGNRIAGAASVVGRAADADSRRTLACNTTDIVTYPYIYFT